MTRGKYETDDQWYNRVLGGEPVESRDDALDLPPLPHPMDAFEGRHRAVGGIHTSPLGSRPVKKHKCFLTHPRLPMSEGVLIGGRATEPPVDIDVLVDLDGGGRYPSFSADAPLVRCVSFPIPNMGVPDAKRLRAMCERIARFLMQGLTVHVGCIGGHGRTGLIVACVHHLLTPGQRDEVKWVRDNYCPHAIESSSQEAMVAAFCVKVEKLIA